MAFCEFLGNYGRSTVYTGRKRFFEMLIFRNYRDQRTWNGFTVLPTFLPGRRKRIMYSCHAYVERQCPSCLPCCFIATQVSDHCGSMLSVYACQKLFTYRYNVWFLFITLWWKFCILIAEIIVHERTRLSTFFHTRLLTDWTVYIHLFSRLLVFAYKYYYYASKLV